MLYPDHAKTLIHLLKIDQDEVRASGHLYLAIPESEQPWLKRPLSELVMRDLTETEYKEILR